ncbi:MAG: NfeD family protein [Planctomycetota bacterium]
MRGIPAVIALLLALLAAAAPAQIARAQGGPVAVPAARKAERIAVLPVTGGIDEVTLWSLERRLKAAGAQGYDAVVLEIDTPGGRVDSMLDICLRLKSDAPVNTVAWIRPKAFSAGTFIALACREIVVAPGSVFGDAAPIAAIPGLGVQPLPAAERAKQESPLLDELDAAAARRGDDPRLLHAFVAVEKELWLIERAGDGVRRFADRDELRTLGLDPASALAKPTDATPARPRSAAELPLGESDRGQWRILEPVDDGSRLLVVQSDEALRWGLAAAEVRDDEALRAFFGADSVTRFGESWTEGVVRFLVSWPVRILLIAVFVIALIIESLHPGVGVPAIVAAAALLLLVGAPAILGLAQWWEVLLVLLGVVLVGVEVFVLPGTGFAGIAGALCVIVGLVASFTGTDPTSAAARSTLLTAAVTTAAGFVLGGIGLWFASRWLREAPILRGAVLSAAIGGPAAGAPVRGEPPMPSDGAAGVADSDLRPSGRARFGNDVFDAQSTGEYIARGAAVRVVGRSGPTVIVERDTA